MSRTAGSKFTFVSLIVFGVVCFSACSPPESGNKGNAQDKGDGDGSGTIDVGGDGDTTIDVTNQEPTANCGDGTVDPDEACDDANQESGDGCGSNCRYIEPGFICPDPGELCRAFAKCGDGQVVFPEQCDDGDLEDGDGCSDICKVEIGFKCDDQSPSTCTETVCGDGIIEGAETCDDKNTLPFDGCGPTCQAEPVCTQEGCTSSCGDGVIVAPETCDDGNDIDGDGCDSKCQPEDGYMCAQGDPCEDINGECGLRLPIVFRDFSQSNNDFEVGCGEMVQGVVKSTLTSGKPVLNSNAGVCIGSAQSFGQWYTDSDQSMTVGSSIVLFENDDGAFVNRMDNEGKRFQRPATGLTWCANDVSAGCDACAPGFTACYAPCTPWGNNQVCADYSAPVFIDGNPLFFPLDDLDGAPFKSSGELASAKIPNELYGGGWNDEPGKPLHNFHFTSEIAHWFQFMTGSEMTLSFIGDDDVWVFINGRLAVDLGGLHVPIEGKFELASDGTVTLTTGNADQNKAPTVVTKSVTDFGLADGGVYEIKVFHAERKKTGSSFKLTLSGFNTARSECTAVCGDGILAAGEQCDDGEDLNVGGHNRCNSDCTLGSYCGDGIKQDVEECDDNDPNAPSGCFGCRVIVVR